MFSAAPSFQLETLGAMSAPAAKRAKVVAAVAFSDCDPSKLEVKTHKDEKGAVYYHAALGGEAPRFNLTPAGCLKVIYGFDMAGAVEMRSFNSKVLAKPNESLGIRVQVADELLDFLGKLDRQCRELFQQTGASHEWSPMVAHNDKYNNDTVKLSVGLTGQCAALKVRVGDEVLKGEGWQFLKDNADDPRSAFSGAEAKVAVKLRLWTQDKKAGVSLVATQLFLKPREKPAVVEEDAFADDIDW